MGYSIKDLKKVQRTEKPQFLGYSGVKGIYFRIPALSTRTRKPGEEEEPPSWYWRGTLRVKDAAGKVIKSVPKWKELGRVTDTRWTAQALEDEAKRLRDLCKAGVWEEPNLQILGIQSTGVGVKANGEAALAPTCDEEWAKYLALKVKNGEINEDTEQDYKGKYRRSVSPFIGSIPVDAVTTPDIERIYQHYAGKVQTQHHLDRILKPFFRWCRRQWKGVDPDLFDRKLPKCKPAQDRLKEAEIRLFGDALRNCDYKQKWNILFLLLTGSRAAVLTQWDPAWVENDWIAIPEGVRLLKDARNILMTPPVRALLPLLTPCTNSALRNCCINLCRKAGVIRISSHDLRRTYISYGEDLLHPGEIMLRLTNHAPKDQIQRIYSKPELEKRRPIALDVAKNLMNLLGYQGLSIDWEEKPQDPVGFVLYSEAELKAMKPVV